MSSRRWRRLRHTPRAGFVWLSRLSLLLRCRGRDARVAVDPDGSMHIEVRGQPSDVVEG